MRPTAMTGKAWSVRRLAMPTLELKIPPPVVALLVAVAMWRVAQLGAPIDMPARLRVLAAAAVALTGLGVSVAGVLVFRRARTTVNPMKPLTTTALVTSGIYALTRNPMYLGVLLVLVGWAVHLSSPWAIVGPVIYVVYINRFQIGPEERALARLFGGRYLAYQATVRRWL